MVKLVTYLKLMKKINQIFWTRFRSTKFEQKNNWSWLINHKRKLIMSETLMTIICHEDEK